MGERGSFFNRLVGDWNDGFDKVGMKEKVESRKTVQIGHFPSSFTFPFAFAENLHGYINDADFADQCERRLEQLKNRKTV